MQKISQKITPFLWFDNNAEEAVNFYTSIFKTSKIKSMSRYSEAGPGPKGALMAASFELNGQEFVALNGGPMFKFTEAISFVINCETQEEVDLYWEKLSEGGQKSRCGWLKDKFGLSWQVVPVILSQLMSDKDAKKSQRVMQAMLKMDKLDIAVLQQAYNG
jgi:predicted 3-demethylubiquinone-9 3-methyltransferase (glyoxalase superfamily)